jgi:hypothetical protein
VSSMKIAALVCLALPAAVLCPAAVCRAAMNPATEWSAPNRSEHVEGVAARTGAASPGVSGSLQDEDIDLPGAPLSFYLFKLGAKNIPPPPRVSPQNDKDSEAPVYDETNWISMMPSSSFTGSN